MLKYGNRYGNKYTTRNLPIWMKFQMFFHIRSIATGF